MKKFLIVAPDRYGRFGHQTYNILAGLLTANITGCKLLLPRYMFFAEKWNQVTDYSKSSAVSSTIAMGKDIEILYAESNIVDSYGNRKWNLDEKPEYMRFINSVCAAGVNTITHLPFDQHPGLLLKLLNKEQIRADLRNIFCFSQYQLGIKRPYACIHVRRGDCTSANHPQWFVSDSFYINLICLLDGLLPQEYKIVVCTQGDIAWLAGLSGEPVLTENRLLISTTKQLFINDSEINDFFIMKNADILFCASSSFSHLAAIIGRHKAILDISRAHSHYMNDVILLNPDSHANIIRTTVARTLCNIT